MPTTPQAPPKVFISYSHDDAQHKDRVLQLAQKMRADGIDCQIDQFDPLKAEGLQRWMMNKIAWADFVLCVCTEPYSKRFAGEQGGGVNWEGGIILQQMYAAGGINKKYYTIGFEPFFNNPHIPDILRPWSYFDVSNDDGYIALYRIIANLPEIIADPVADTLRHLPPRNP